MTATAETQAGMVAAIGASITGARAVGKPDPTDDDLYFDLAAADFAAADIRSLFPRAKALALDAIRDVAALTALALFLTASGLWAGIFRGVI